MKVLLIDNMSILLDFALRCKDKKHEVRVYMSPDKRGDRSTVGDGMIDKVADWRPSMRWADIIIVSDNAKLLRDIEPYRKAGYPIFNAHKPLTEWELDRDAGQKSFEAAGIKTIPSIPFTSYDKAIAFIEKTGKRYVSKPNGDVDKALTYVSKGPADMIAMMERWKRLGKAKGPFILQEVIPGIEMAVSGFFGPNGFSKYFLENFEFKKLMDGDKGPNTGEQGTVMRYTEESKLADMVLKPFAPELFRQGYCGFIDVAVMIDEKGTPWPLEHTLTRFGVPLWLIQSALHPEPVEWMLDLIDGFDSFKPSTDIAVGVVVSIPDYPYSRLTQKVVSGYPIWGITPSNKQNVHLAEVKMGIAPVWEGGKIVRKPMPVTAGDYVYVATGIGKSVSQAATNAYKTIDQIEIPNSPMYRTDIGKRLEKQLPKLHKLGFATSWKY